MIAPDLAAFLQEGIGIHIGTRNVRLEPNGSRALAVKVDPDGVHLTIYLPAGPSRSVLDDLHANGQGAVVFGRPVDDRSCQVKGTFVDMRPGHDEERVLVEAQWEGLMRNFDQIGIPRAIFAGWKLWPVVAVRLKAHSVFEQTPGPDAGKPIP